MIVVNVVPTGLGAEIGGFAGDATPASNLLASVCDTLITHPNVVNASDINEMSANTLYVEGSMLDDFLEGRHSLQRVKRNRVLVAVNPPLKPETVNAVSAARATLGLDARIVVLTTPLRMVATKNPDGTACGTLEGHTELVDQLHDKDFDALAIASQIEVPKDVALDYFRNGGVNPWGGVEAKLSKVLGRAFGRPVAHAPIENGSLDFKDYDFISDPREAAELVSVCYLHCVLKGLHKAPQISLFGDVRLSDVGCMVSADSGIGRPHRACMRKGIPLIIVQGNKTVLMCGCDYPKGTLFAANYFEAAGMIAAMNAGICLDSIRRPLQPTEIL